MFYIYKIVINSEVAYVGQTNNPPRRLSEYVYKLKNNKLHNIRLQRSMMKYGFSKDSFEVIFCTNTKEMAVVAEQYFCDLLKPFCNVRKCVTTNAGVPRSEETKRKLSLAHKGKKLSDSHKKSLSIAFSGEKNYFYGKRLKPHNTRMVRCVETGEIYGTLKSASLSRGLCGAAVRNSIYRKGLSGGLHWEYV